MNDSTGDYVELMIEFVKDDQMTPVERFIKFYEQIFIWKFEEIEFDMKQVVRFIF